MQAIANYHCKTGENPLWDDRREIFYWTDIPGGKLYRYDPATGEHGCIYEGEPVGGFTLQEDGNLLLFRVEDIAVRHEDGRVETLIRYTDEGMERFNDVIAAPDGGVFAGTIGIDHGGGLYRIDRDGTVTNLFRGTNVANGMAFTPDQRTMYWTDSPARRIDAFDYDPVTGELSNRRTCLDTGDLPGVPDGMTIDTEGNLFSARWDGGAVYVFAPDRGEPIERIDVPVPKASSCVFGGADLCDLYITTAAGDGADGEEAGTLYRIRLNASGLPERRSKILL